MLYNIVSQRNNQALAIMASGLDCFVFAALTIDKNCFLFTFQF